PTRVGPSLSRLAAPPLCPHPTVGRTVPPLLAVKAASAPGHALRSHCAPVWYGCCTSIKTGEGALPPPPGVVQQCERPCGLPIPTAVSSASSSRIPAHHSRKPSVQLSLYSCWQKGGRHAFFTRGFWQVVATNSPGSRHNAVKAWEKS